MSGAQHDAELRAMSQQRLAFVAILIVAAALRLAQLNTQSLSMDEMKDLATARGGWASIQAAENRFPPLYHALLWGWLRAVPVDADGRGLSTLCGVLAVAAVGQLGRVVGGDKTALWAAGAAALAPLGVWYSVESRVYSLYFLLGAAALWQFTAALEDGRRKHWIGFAIVSLAGVYTHYYFGLLIALAGITFLASWPRRPQLTTGLAAFTVIGLGCVPALVLLQGDLDQPWGYARTSEFSSAGLAYTYFSYLSGYALGPSGRDLHTMSGRDAALAAAPWAASLGTATLVLLAQATAAFPYEQRRRWAVWFLLLGLAPAIVIGVLSHFASFGYNVRHTAWAAVPLWGMIAHGAAHGRPRRLACTMAAVLVIGMVAANYHRAFTTSHQNEDVRGAAAFLVSRQPRPTFVISGYMAAPLERYLPSDWPVQALPDVASDPGASAQAIATVRDALSADGDFWLVYTRPFHADPRGEALARMKAAFNMEPSAEFAGVQLYRGTLSE
jgi:hypothetical protein